MGIEGQTEQNVTGKTVQLFNHAVTGFIHNVNSLKEFYRALQPLVSKIDAKSQEKLKEMLADITIKKSKKKSGTVTLIAPDVRTYKALMRIVQGTASTHTTFNTDLLYQNIVINLCTYIEILILETARIYYTTTADGIFDDTTLAFKEIKKLATIDDVLGIIIEKKILKLGHDSFADWITFFNKDLRLDIQKLQDKYLVSLTELFQRRHLYVHNGGKINANYLRNCDNRYLKRLNTNIKEGVVIKSTSEYLDERLRNVAIFGVLFGHCAWYKLSKQKEMNEQTKIRENLLNNFGFELLAEGDYQGAEEYLGLIIDKFTVSEAIEFYLRANYWQSLKWQNKLTKKEKARIIAIDLDNKDYMTKLAVFSLLGNKEAFFDNYEKAIAVDEFTEGCLTWPIFREMKKDKRFASVFEKHKKPESSIVKKGRVKARTKKKPKEKAVKKTSAKKKAARIKKL